MIVYHRMRPPKGEAATGQRGFPPPRRRLERNFVGRIVRRIVRRFIGFTDSVPDIKIDVLHFVHAVLLEGLEKKQKVLLGDTVPGDDVRSALGGHGAGRKLRTLDGSGRLVLFAHFLFLLRDYRFFKSSCMIVITGRGDR